MQSKIQNPKSKIALVIPSIRAGQLRDFFAAWRADGDWDVAIVIEDGDRRTFDLGAQPWPVEHYSRAEIERKLGSNAWIISQRDSACRSFGFLVAAELGCEWILTLDDDVRPHGRLSLRESSAGICAAHLAALDSHAVCRPAAGIRTRGLPYRNLGQVRPLLNLGLWSGVPDLDGPQGLLTPCDDFTPCPGSTLAHPRCRYPLCGMHLFFHHSLVPALYFPLMGAGQPYRRFDDIWAGWIFQRVAAQCGVAWTFGEPHVRHVRASDPFRNLIAEAPGIALNEGLWERIDSIELTARDVAGCAAEIAADLARDKDPYLAELGRALAIWADLSA